MIPRVVASIVLSGALGCVPETRVDYQSNGDANSDVVLNDVLERGTIDDAQVGDRVEIDAVIVDRLDIDVEERIDSGPSDAGSLPDLSHDTADPIDGLVSFVDGAISDVFSVDARDGGTASDAGCSVCSAAHATSACIDGSCRIQRCDDGFGDCNGVPGDGCEADLRIAPNCGSCGNSCAPVGICLGGVCSAQRSCDSRMQRGCGLIFVEGAEFGLGLAEASTGEPLPGRITVSRIAVDSHEVTVARFRRFWIAGHPSPSLAVRYPSGQSIATGSVAEPTPALPGQRCNWTSAASTLEDHPVNCIDWNTAMAFCAWDGGRLPTEAEYEYIAVHRAVGGLPSPRRFPWGDEDPISMASVYPRPTPCERTQFQNCSGDDGGYTRRVGSFEPSGSIFDLSGNVSEWMADSSAPYGSAPCWGPVPVALLNPLCSLGGESHSIRGGDFETGSVEPMLPASRSASVGSARMHTIGFRCVRSP